MAGFFRLGTEIECPSQDLLYHHGGVTELAWNVAVFNCHYGEDGPGVCMEITRDFFISNQSERGYWTEFRPPFDHAEMNDILLTEDPNDEDDDEVVDADYIWTSIKSYGRPDIMPDDSTGWPREEAINITGSGWPFGDAS